MNNSERLDRLLTLDARLYACGLDKIKLEKEVKDLKAALATKEEQMQEWFERANAATLKVTFLEDDIKKLQATVTAREQELHTLHANFHREAGVPLSNDGASVFLDGAGEVPLRDMNLNAAGVDRRILELRLEITRLKGERA